MEREELLGKVEGSLGSTRLTLSEDTINGELEDALEGIDDDASVDDAFIERIAKRLKRMDGNLHRDVASEMKKNKDALKAKLRKGKPDELDKQGAEDEPEWFKAYRISQEERIQKIEDERKAAVTAKKKNDIATAVKKGVKEKFDSAGVEAKEYFINAAMRDLEIDEDSNVDALVKDAEKNYYKQLKEAGVDDVKGNPRYGHAGGGKAGSSVDKYFERKKKREGYGSKD